MYPTPQKRRPTFVSFSGIDGAGKSTQIEALRTRLTEAGVCVSLIAFWDDIARLKGIRETTGHKVFKGEKGVGSPEAPVNRRDKNVQSWYMTGVRFFLYFVDAVSLRLVVRRALRSDGEFIIFDRYAYDELANLKLRNPFVRLYVRLIMKLVPQPDVSFLLDADPVQARARKPEYPLDFLVTCRASYMALCDMIGGITVIPPMPVPDVARSVLKHALDQLSGEGIENGKGIRLTEQADRSGLIRS
jgi:thymidylate kinase